MVQNESKKVPIAVGLVVLLILASDFLKNRPTLLIAPFPGRGDEFSSDASVQSSPAALRSSSSQPPLSSVAQQGSTLFPRLTDDCDKWVVATSQNLSPKDCANSFNEWKDISSWCMVIVGDEFDSEWELLHREDFIFLSAKQQAAIKHPFVQHVLSSLTSNQVNNSFSRKNIGYLFAIWHGAKVIYDADITELSSGGDIRSPHDPIHHFGTGSRVLVKYLRNNELQPSSSLFDPMSQFPLFNNSKSLVNSTRWSFGSIEYSSIGMMLLFSRDMDHHRCVLRECGTRFLPPNQNYALPTSNSMVFFQGAFWGLFLPATVSPTFRFFWAQKILHELNLGLVFELTSTEQKGYSAGKRQVITSTSERLVNFLASKECYAYPEQDFNENLPARISVLMMELVDHEYIGMDDVYNMQEWLLALIDVGYEFPSLTTLEKTHNQIAAMQACRSSSLSIIKEPSLERQAYLASPAFNVDLNGQHYEDFVANLPPQRGKQLFHDWMSLPRVVDHPAEDHAVLKIVAMTMNEWPLIKDWVTYHGELIGFENLYVIDGSTDIDAIQFLIYARMEWGVNVMFSSKGLDELALTLSNVAREIRKASDFVAKLDPDEFLVARKQDSNCSHASDQADDLITLDCTLSPYMVQNILDHLRVMTTGERLRFGYVMKSQATASACKNDALKNDIAAFDLLPIADADRYKTISDSRTLAGLDLGGHKNHFVPPFGSTFGTMTDLATLHFHERCFDQEVANSRKAILSHKFIDKRDSDEDAIQKLMKLQRDRGNSFDRDGLCDVIKQRGPSWHKVLFYLKYLLGCITEENFYESTEARRHNPDFVHFLNSVRLHYGPL